MKFGFGSTRSRRPRRLPPGYRFVVSDSEQVSPPDSTRTVLRLFAADGTPVLTGTVSSVGQYSAVKVVDYCLQQELGEVLHADSYSMTDAAWIHYKLRVNWWHRNVTQYATVWAVVVALLMGLLSLVLSLWQEPPPCPAGSPSSSAGRILPPQTLDIDGFSATVELSRGAAAALPRPFRVAGHRGCPGTRRRPR